MSLLRLSCFLFCLSFTPILGAPMFTTNSSLRRSSLYIAEDADIFRFEADVRPSELLTLKDVRCKTKTSSLEPHGESNVGVLNADPAGHLSTPSETNEEKESSLSPTRSTKVDPFKIEVPFKSESAKRISRPFAYSSLKDLTSAGGDFDVRTFCLQHIGEDGKPLSGTQKIHDEKEYEVEPESGAEPVKTPGSKPTI
ncbi:hypothetical protein PGTUg99_017515 [Puccinia graminis f. sp. tritici]|uniref:Uncharacterized protein n=1 Tax=Puccinia graminis f. sp. tritici TaxID=56615 RepID=A0A5B0PW75_PUCGR|nr:hypothetical protein PGTUg99_017515 [Puccinia graminis f. sp. tritici]